MRFSDESRLATRVLVCPFQLFLDIFPHVTMQRQFEFAEGTHDGSAFDEFLHSKVVLTAADWTRYRQSGFLH
jgi:hypothetical protein